MGRAPNHKKMAYKGKQIKDNECSQQFPDCPAIPNHNDCHTCPLWGTGISKPYKEKGNNEMIQE